MNRLSTENSAYLRHAADQKIDWHPWSEEPFDKARRENKPVFLSSGAIWCHWCHVMAKESFYDDEVAAILNEHFVAVKLDRDENPDIDRRYQQALGAMGFGGGWPLSMFLTPDKKPFYGGTYFPLDEAYGRLGFKTLLRAIAELYKNKRAEVDDQSTKILDALKARPTSAGSGGTLEEATINQGMNRIMRSMDTRFGGFGTAPKFPMSGAIEFLLGRYFFSRDETVAAVLQKTLASMATGGFHDQLAGGFHRYSTDQAWIIPHFEKMADDNAWLLRNYVDACALFADPYLRETATGIIEFTRKELSNGDGGFYASQDADVTPDDEGGYFTWTLEEFRAVLDDEEYRVLSTYLLHDRGTMHHDPSRKVLYIDTGIEEMAEKVGMDVGKVMALIAGGREKLLKARDGRQKPFIDTALYTSLNGMLISAYFRAYKLLRHEEIKQFALKSLQVILDLNMKDCALFHGPAVKGLLDDHIFLIDALIGAYEVTGDSAHLNLADRLMEDTIARFWDTREGGFFDTDEEVLGMRLKGVEDTPHPSANALAIMVLLKLAFMTGKDSYRTHAEKALQFFSAYAVSIGEHGAYYLCALDMFFNGLELTINAPPDSELARTALSASRPYTSIVYSDDKGSITPCVRNVCYEPIREPDALKKVLASPNGAP